MAVRDTRTPLEAAQRHQETRTGAGVHQTASQRAQATTAPHTPMPGGLVVDLPLPPSTNHAYRNAPGRGRALTDEARRWQTGAAALTRGALREQMTAPLAPPLALSLFVYLANQRRDLDNCIKLAQDAVCAALGVDDRQVAELHAYRALAKETPHLVVVVRSLAD